MWWAWWGLIGDEDTLTGKGIWQRSGYPLIFCVHRLGICPKEESFYVWGRHQYSRVSTFTCYYSQKWTAQIFPDVLILFIHSFIHCPGCLVSLKKTSPLSSLRFLSHRHHHLPPSSPLHWFGGWAAYLLPPFHFFRLL